MKIHTDKTGEYYWDKEPSKYWLYLPYLRREQDEECGHFYWSYGVKGFIPRKWRKVKIYTRYDLDGIIDAISPVNFSLFDRLNNMGTKGATHEWSRE